MITSKHSYAEICLVDLEIDKTGYFKIVIYFNISILMCEMQISRETHRLPLCHSEYASKTADFNEQL